MELLQYEERQFRFKLINVFLQYIKTALQLTVFGFEGVQLFMQYEQNMCSPSQQTFINITYNGALALVIFNTVSAIYILCQKHFVRIEFFITYGLNLIWFVSIMAFALKELYFEKSYCTTFHLMVKTVLYLSIINQVDVVLIMILKHETANRQVNICSNTVVIILLMTSEIPITCDTDSQSMKFMMVAANLLRIKYRIIQAVIFFTGINVSLAIFTKMKEQLYNTLKFCIVLVLSFLIINYLLVVYYIQSGNIKQNDHCIPLLYIARSYVWIVPITLSGMIFILYSLNIQKLVDNDGTQNDAIPRISFIAPHTVNPAVSQSVFLPNTSFHTPNRLTYADYNNPTFHNESGILPHGSNQKSNLVG